MDGFSTIDRALIVLGLLQIATFGLFWFDKSQARNGGRRVRERTLLVAALLGGFGAWFGQHLLRHKTRKEPFRTLLGAALVVHVAGSAGVMWLLLR
ncbi:DUF1294 domain-containing protein [Brevundimonas sp. NPDC092305]|uniref:DUF1294 domain-containing protein n=1 Tax=Brevundimonas sp. NPDC092305 TaxID=3363957 RepID=UPI00382F5393